MIPSREEAEASKKRRKKPTPKTPGYAKPISPEGLSTLSPEDREFAQEVVEDLGNGRVGIRSSRLETVIQKCPAKIVPIAIYLGELIGVNLVGEGPVSADGVVTAMLRETVDHQIVDD